MISHPVLYHEVNALNLYVAYVVCLVAMLTTTLIVFQEPEILQPSIAISVSAHIQDRNEILIAITMFSRSGNTTEVLRCPMYG